MYTKRFIGLSMSFCIRDILSGRIKIEDVFCIVANTGFSTIEGAIENYGPDYWRDYSSDTVRELLEKMWPIIYQPRLVNENAMCSIAYGYWFDTTTGKQGPRFEKNTDIEDESQDL